MNYIMFYRISQDFIENLFGNIRSYGGFNCSPTAYEFRSHLRKCLLLACKDKKTGNCLPDDEIQALTVGEIGVDQVSFSLSPTEMK
jgi:hypothetical protein